MKCGFYQFGFQCEDDADCDECLKCYSHCDCAERESGDDDDE